MKLFVKVKILGSRILDIIVYSDNLVKTIKDAIQALEGPRSLISASGVYLENGTELLNDKKISDYDIKNHSTVIVSQRALNYNYYDLNNK